MKTTVVIATYNGEKYIEEQLESILAQTILPDEVIVSDDGSTDETVDIVTKFIRNNDLDGNWKVLLNKKNKGYARNFLEAALTAQGEIIFFCDQDDIWLCDRLQKMTEKIESNNAIKLLSTNLEPFYCEDDARKWSKKSLAEMKNDETIQFYQLTDQGFHLKRSGCTMCIRKEFLHEIMKYWVDGWAHDDFVWKMAAAENGCAVFQYTSLRRRMHSNNASSVKKRDIEKRIRQLKSFLEQYAMLEKYIADHKVDIAQDNIRKNIKSIELRLNVLEKRKYVDWMRLFFLYKDCYPRIKGLYLDLYLTIFGSYTGVN